MSTVVSELLVKIGADIAGLKNDMDAAKSAVANGMLDMEKATNLAKNALVGLVGVASVAGFANMVKSVWDATGAFYDLSTKTGASAAALMAFKSVGATTETSVDSIAGAMNRLALGMSKADEDGKGAAAALRAIGIDFNSFKAMKPEDQMLAVAGALGKFEDGAGKTAVAMTLFGKSGAELLPFLKDLGDQAEEVAAKLTDQEKAIKANQAAMADAFGDNLTIIRRNADGWKKELSLGLLPAFYEATEAIKAMNSGTGGLKATVTELARDGTLANWARGAMTALSYLLDVVQGLFSLIPMLGKAIAAVAAAAVQMFDSLRSAMQKANDTTLSVNDRLSGAWTEMKKGFTGVSEIGSAAATDISAIWNQKLIGQTFRDTMAGLKGVQAGGTEAKKGLDFSNEADKSTEALKRQKEAADKLLESYGKMADATASRLAAQQSELESGQKLTDAEKDYIKVMSDVRDGKITLEALEKSGTLAKLQANIATAAAIEKLREEKKAREDLEKTMAAVAAATAKYENAQANETEQMRQSLVQLREQNEKLGLSESQIVAREAAVLRATATDKLFEAQQQGGNYQLEEQARLLKERANELEKGVAIKEAKAVADEWKKTTDSINDGLTDALMRGFESGKGFFQTFKDTLVNAFKTMVLQPTIKMILAPISGALGSLFSGNAMAGTGGGAGGLMSSIGNLFNGTTIGNTLGNAGAFGADSIGNWLVNNTTGGLNSLGGSLMQNSGMIGTGLGMFGNGMAGFGISSALSGGYSLGGSNLVNGIAGIASMIPGIGPIAGVVGGLVNRAFGRKPKEVTSAGIEGTITGGDATGQQYQDWVQKGGWFRSDKSGTDYSAMNADIGAALDLGASAVLEKTKAWAEALQLPATTLADVTTEFKTQLTGNAQEDQAAIADLLNTYQGALTEQYQLILEPFQKAGETLAGTLGRLAELAKFSDNINQLGGVFSAIAGSSIPARENIIALAGGLDQLAAKAGRFVQDYYSDAEKMGIAATQTIDLLKSLGFTSTQIDALASREDFRALVESLGPALKAGDETAQKQLVALLELAPQFTTLGDYAKSQGLTLEEIAKQAPVVAVLDQMLPEQKSTTGAVTDLTTTVKEGNLTLEKIVTAVTEGNLSIASGLQAIAAAQSAAQATAAAAVAAANAAAASAASAATSASLAASSPSYNFDVGAGP